jgi:murein DD-endopeptidase MepM/ murein hydrolase activator NlpD
MAKVKYHYNTKSLSYERVNLSVKHKVLKTLGYLATGLVFSTIVLLVAYNYIDSPKEKMLKREVHFLKQQYAQLDEKLKQTEVVLGDIQQRDDNIYRVIFETSPIDAGVREAGFGGVNRYKNLNGYNNSNLVAATAKKLDAVTKKLYVQSKSFDELFSLAQNKEKMLASIPAIMPVAGKDLKRVASGYGYRIHPIYKTRKLHTGMDFTAPTNTPIYSTGIGTVVEVKRLRSGYGHHVVVDHGFGYKTLYAHMNRIKVVRGQRVNRGQELGTVGNTGTSTAPHLHYEVHKSGVKIDPANFYYNDLNPEEFAEMLEISSRANQSFD